MPDIKTRDVVKGTIKTVDKTAVAGERMKDAYVRMKEKGEHSVYSSESSSNEYAADHLTGGIKTLTHEGIHQIEKQGQKGLDATKANISKAKAEFQKKRTANQPKEQHHAPQADSLVQPVASGKSTPAPKMESPPQSVKHQTVPRQAAPHTQAKTIKQRNNDRNIRQAGKAVDTAAKPVRSSVKTAARTVKTADTTAPVSIKTAQASAATAQKAAVAAEKTAQIAAQSFRAAAKAAATTAKAAAKAVASAVKGIIKGTKALISAIAAGGWVAILVVVVICLIGLIVGSSFGIFFSSEDTGSSQTMQEVVREVNDEYLARLDEIKAYTTYDELETSGARAVWPEVLAIYAVKTTTDPDNPQEVASITDEKKELLKDIFWQMNEISHETDTVSEIEIIESDDGNGNIVEKEVPVTNTYLYITVEHKTAEEMAEELNFNDDQMAQLEALLADENDSLWTAVLYGITTSDGQIVAVAQSQIGNTGGEPYWSWYGFSSRVEWCACFVSWCANECGYIEAGVIPKFAGCVNGVQWFKDRAQWVDNSAEPTPGMIIFFDWDDDEGQDGLADHVGIVEKVENGRVYTIEGNTSDSCRERSYSLGNYEILGYGIPAY